MDEMNKQDEDDYGLSPTKQVNVIPAPEVHYQPPKPESNEHAIGLIGAEASANLFTQLSKMWVSSEGDCQPLNGGCPKAKRRIFPDADVYDYRALLERQDITVIDATPHPADRLPITVMQLLQENTCSVRSRLFLIWRKGSSLLNLRKNRTFASQSTRTVVGLRISAISAMPSTPASLVMSRRLTFHCNGTRHGLLVHQPLRTSII